MAVVTVQLARNGKVSMGKASLRFFQSRRSCTLTLCTRMESAVRTA